MSRPPEALPDTVHSRAVRVQVISDQPIIRAGLYCLLAHPDDLARPANGSADVVLYDVIGLRHGDDPALKVAVARHPGRVLAVSRPLERNLTVRALREGAVATIPLGTDADAFLAIILLTANGYLDDGSPADLANRRVRDNLLGHDRGLTPREQEVLALIVAGASNLEIALELYLTENTVKSEIRTTYAKSASAPAPKPSPGELSTDFRPPGSTPHQSSTHPVDRDLRESVAVRRGQ